MKGKFFLTCLLLSIVSGCYSRNYYSGGRYDSYCIEGGMSYSGLARHQNIGFYFRYVFRCTDRWGIGYGINFFQRANSEDYGYHITKPRLQVSEIFVSPALNVFENDHFRFCFSLYAGYMAPVLQDKAILVWHSGSHGKYLGPKNVMWNDYFSVGPGIDLYYKISDMLRLNVGTRYIYTMGKTAFGDPEDFQGLMVTAGISFGA